jgi:hypothetical protein
MNRDTVVLGFLGAFAFCVIVAGFSGQLASADPHQFDAVMGLTPTASECTDHNASTAKPSSRLDVNR